MNFILNLTVSIFPLGCLILMPLLSWSRVCSLCNKKIISSVSEVLGEIVWNNKITKHWYWEMRLVLSWKELWVGTWILTAALPFALTFLICVMGEEGWVMLEAPLFHSITQCPDIVFIIPDWPGLENVVRFLIQFRHFFLIHTLKHHLWLMPWFVIEIKQGAWLCCLICVSFIECTQEWHIYIARGICYFN